MKLSKNTKKAALAVAGSLAGLAIGKWRKCEDTYPYILIGGFLGNFIGEEYLPDDNPLRIGG